MAEETARPKRKREATRAAILSATSQIIAERGLDNFTISDVARRGEVNRALIYHYFKNRDNLVAHALDYLIGQHTPSQPAVSADAAERATRTYIQYPEIGRVIFQLLLLGRPLGQLGKRLTDVIAAVKQLRQERAPNAAFDPEVDVVILALAELSWSFARSEVASLLGISVEEADERLISRVRFAVDATLRSMGR